MEPCSECLNSTASRLYLEPEHCSWVKQAPLALFEKGTINRKKYSYCFE